MTKNEHLFQKYTKSKYKNNNIFYNYSIETKSHAKEGDKHN